MIQFYVLRGVEREKKPAETRQEINWCLFLIGKLISGSALPFNISSLIASLPVTLIRSIIDWITN